MQQKSLVVGSIGELFGKPGAREQSTPPRLTGHTAARSLSADQRALEQDRHQLLGRHRTKWMACDHRSAR